MTETMWRGKYLEVRRDGTWEYAARVGGMGASVILAVTDAREVVLVEQLRRAHGRRTIELPAGLIGDDDSGEGPAATAARELREETGFAASDWEHVGEFATSPGMSSELFHLFRAGGLVREAEGGGVDGEEIVVHLAPLDGIAAWLAEQRASGKVIDSRLVAVLGLV